MSRMADCRQDNMDYNSSDSDPEYVGSIQEEEEERPAELMATEEEHGTELINVEEQQRYRRLQHLLNKSSIYSSFLLQRMTNQREEDEKKGKRRRKPHSKKMVVAESVQASKPSGNFYSLRKKRPVSEVAVSPTKQPNHPKRKKNGVKNGIYKVEDYIDSKGHLRAEDQPSPPQSQSQSQPLAAEVADCEDDLETEETRTICGEKVSSRQPQLFSGGVMRGYQLDGMEWLKVLFENGVNGILGDEMGLGKTVQCIGLIAHLVEHGVKGPYLIVAPLSTLPNWCSEFERFTPKISTILYHGKPEDRELIRRRHFSASARRKASTSGGAALPVVITSYEMCLTDQKFFQTQEWKYLVVDEGQRIKNLNCKLVRTLKTFNATNRLLLTGTPLQNNLAELWSLLNFLLPEVFDDLNCFQQYFDFTAIGDHSGTEKILAQEREQSVLSTLHQILSPFLLRRLKSDVELKIPPKKELLVYAPITPHQLTLYRAVVENTIFDIVGDKKKINGEAKVDCAKDENSLNAASAKTKRKCTQRTDILMRLHSDEGFLTSILNGDDPYCKELEHLHSTTDPSVAAKKKPKTSVVNVSLSGKHMQLRKVVNHPYLVEFPLTADEDYRVDEELVGRSGKMLLLDTLLPALLQRGHKVLIFSQMTRMLDILELYVEMRGVTSCRLDGSMPVAVRQEQIRSFNSDPEVNVFLISTRAGGLGVNLTAADTVIIYDSDWNPQADLQAQDRCHRIGQTKPVLVYRFVTANTIDQRMVEIAAGKRKLEKLVIHKGMFKGYSKTNQVLSVAVLKELLQGAKDHDTVFDSGSTSFSISETVLSALLDRSLTHGPPREQSKDGRLFCVLDKSEEQEGTLGSVNAE